MKGYRYILSKQTQWALNRDIPLTGSKGVRGTPAYTMKLDQNLFEPLEPEVRVSFQKGDGNEISGTVKSPAKMQAVHSSSALSVNLFQYWLKIRQLPAIAAACGFCCKGTDVSEKIVFEDKYKVDNRFIYSPNIDVVFWNSVSSKYKRFAVECKFSEAYSFPVDKGLKHKYLEHNDLWSDIPNLHKLAESISPNDDRNNYLHVAQLIKHILGLKLECGKDGFRLLYLWFDVPGGEGAVHRKEIKSFTGITKADSVKFHALSYQELIVRLARDYRQEHPEYIKYMTERYL